MRRWLAGIVDVRPGEVRRVGGMFALHGLIIATAYILKPVRSSLFLSEFGSEQLPYVYIVVAIVLGVVAAGFAKWVPRANLPSLLAGASYFFAFQLLVFWRRCCTARSKLLTSLCRSQSHPAQYVSGIPSAVILLSISHPIRCSTRCLANVRARISGPMSAL